MKFSNIRIYTKCLRITKRRYITRFSAIIVLVIILCTYLLILKGRNKTKRLLSQNFDVVFHLDLKGAPPKLSYLTAVLEELKKYGVNILLIEYEDMFPYQGSLRNLSVPHAYSPKELKSFLMSVADLGIEIMPLVQTFGHMEFALKHKEFAHLSENPKNYDSICPSQDGSHVLIKMMLEQIIKFHKQISPIKHLHIGCDEVFHINECSLCRKTLTEDLDMFERHVMQVCYTVHSLSPGTKVLIWDDMMRGKNRQRMLNEPIHLPIEPVVWNYLTTDNLVKPIDLYNYNGIFGKIWIASAFKGADGVNATFPVLSDRFINHYSWLTRIINLMHPPLTEFRGIILTGWSRYNHFLPACELLPVSMPSLIINLSLIKLFKSKTDLDISKTWKDFYFTYLHGDMKYVLDCDLKDLFQNEEPLLCDSTSDLVTALKTLETEFPRNESVQNKSLDNLLDLMSVLGIEMRKWYDEEVIEQYINEKLKTFYNIHNDIDSRSISGWSDNVGHFDPFP